MSSTLTSVELPPRRLKENQGMTILRNQSSLEIMVQMGFPKQRVEKALAATGDKGVQLASDWLLAHVNDPKLDDYCPRDYILYLCPVGQLQQEFLDFWQKSYQECGWNKAHNYFPHMTLSSFFQADDHMVSQLSHVLKVVAGRVRDAPESLGFELFSSPIYMGLFANEKSETFLKAVTVDFSEEMQKVGIEVEAHKKQLHISLAYHYALDKHKKLQELSRNIHLGAPARWDLRVYSRAQIEPNCHVRRVLFAYVSTANDELDLCPGDFLVVKEVDVLLSEDGWCIGTSWMTGCSGMFPLIYTERTAETETWTMHKSIPIIGTDLNIESNQSEEEHLKTLRSGRYLASKTSASRLVGYATMPASLFQQQQLEQTSGTPLSEAEGKLPSTSTSSSSSSSSSSSCSSSATSSMAIESSSTSVVNSSSSSSSNIVISSSSSSGCSSQSPPELFPSSDSLPTEAKVVRPPIAVFTTKNKGGKEVTKAHSGSDRDPETQPNPGISKAPAVDPPRSPVSIDSFCRTSATDAISFSIPLASIKGPRQLYIVKHGESINSTFGKDWIQNSFSHSGKYTRYDLNMPKVMPKRKTGPEEFASDSPLTVQGCFQSKLLGEAMKEKAVKISHVYCSPSFKCIQSIASFLQGFDLPIGEVRIEPGLFEWLGFSKQSGPPKLMGQEELREAGYSINSSYVPVCSLEKLFSNVNETVEQFYERSYLVTKEILKRHESQGGSILFMTQGSNLDSCTRKLVGQSVRSSQSFQEISRKIPYCAVCVAQEATVVLDTWYLIEPPVLPFAHSNNPKYNWTALTTPGLS